MVRCNPFKQVYDAAIERGESVYRAIDCAKILYADYIRILYGNDYGPEFIIERFEEYTVQLNKVINR